MQNIEFKCELRDLDAARAQCRALGAQAMGTLTQTDTYFRMTDGRLKRREAAGEPTEWIYYHRADRLRPRMSNYTILTDEQARLRWGSSNLQPWKKVRKVRELWLLDNVRIHLDAVEGLGSYIEFEAIVNREHDVKSCHRTIEQLRADFDPILGEPVSASYSDLVEA